MIAFFISLLLVNFFFAGKLYRTLRIKKFLFTDRYSMTIAMNASMIIPFVLSMLLVFILPLSFTVMSIFSVVLGAAVGILFGALGKPHSILSGVSSGIIGGLTGAMVGGVILDPSLCGLPSVSNIILKQNMLIFSIFSTLLCFLSCYFIKHSLRV